MEEKGKSPPPTAGELIRACLLYTSAADMDDPAGEQRHDFVQYVGQEGIGPVSYTHLENQEGTGKYGCSLPAGAEGRKCLGGVVWERACQSEKGFPVLST